jgi:hypothetical protein
MATDDPLRNYREDFTEMLGEARTRNQSAGETL